MKIIRTFLRKLSSFQIIILGFAAVIFIGALLLTLPISSKSREFTSFGDAIFTSTSAVCVTGLVVKDTATYWSLFGQAIILGMIQIGGLGIILVAVSLAMLSGKRISLMQRRTLQDAISAPQVGGIVRLTSFILKITFSVEAAGALLMMPVFCGRFGPHGIWMSVFHSVSAFCNAGFDIMGDRTGPFSSLTFFRGNILIVFVVCALIVTGGIGFVTWDDVVTHRLKLKKYRMQSKVILITTALLILIPTIYLFFGEFSYLPFKDRFCESLFQAITPRTAGFNTADLTTLSTIGRSMMIILMLVGGSPGSTAGGMKTTTFSIMFANIFSTFRKRKNVQLFGRRIEDSVVKNAAALVTMYITLAVVGAQIISAAEEIPISDCLFETASAIGTVGLTLGITPLLSGISRLVLILLMFFGRIGGITIIFAAASKRATDVSLCPMEKITVG